MDVSTIGFALALGLCAALAAIRAAVRRKGRRSIESGFDFDSRKAREMHSCLGGRIFD